MSKLDLDHIESLAMAATAGPWVPFESSGACEYSSWVEAPKQEIVCDDDEKVCWLAPRKEFANCRFIAAANPAAVLELCAELRELRRQLAVLAGARIAARYDSSDDIAEELTEDLDERWPDWRSWAEGDE